jgi:hypothetical protein
MIAKKIEKKNTKNHDYTRHVCAENVPNVVAGHVLPRFCLLKEQADVLWCVGTMKHQSFISSFNDGQRLRSCCETSRRQ